MTKNPRSNTYFSVGQRDNPASSAFSDVQVSREFTVRVMSKRVFEKALDSANTKLRELSSRSKG